MPIPTLGVEEFQFKDDGIILNNDAPGMFVDITKIAGLDSTDLRISTHDREGMDGAYIDALYEGIRTVILDGTMYTSNRDVETWLDQLKGNFAPSANPQPLYFGTDFGLRCVYGKSYGVKYDKDELRRIGKCDIQIQIACEDPRIYFPDILTAQVILGTTGLTGRGYNKSYMYGYGPVSSSNIALLTVGGNRTQPAIIRIYGPITNPVLIYGSTTMVFNLTIDNGDYLEINLNNRTVKLNGVAGRRNKLTLYGNWFLISPGINSFSLSGSATLAGTTKLTVSANAGAWR